MYLIIRVNGGSYNNFLKTKEDARDFVWFLGTKKSYLEPQSA
jgi:hypothetical protein